MEGGAHCRFHSVPLYWRHTRRAVIGIMNDISSLKVILSIAWFLVYWIFGGVFFALLTIMRLGNVRKLRFSCIFSLLAAIVGAASAWYGIRYSEQAIAGCLSLAENRAEVITAVFGCGFVGVVGAFAVGILAIVLGGFIIMSISKTNSKPWISMDGEEEDEGKKQPPKEGGYFGE